MPDATAQIVGFATAFSLVLESIFEVPSGYFSDKIVTEKLGSRTAAFREFGLNNRAEDSHQPTLAAKRLIY